MPCQGISEYFCKRSYQPKRGNGEKMLRICLGFSQGHLEILLACYVSQCLLLRMEHCLGGKQRARKEGNINIICTSLAPSGDVNIGQVENGTKKKKNPRFSTVTCCFLYVLSRIRFGEHVASPPPCSKFQYSLWLYATKM